MMRIGAESEELKGRRCRPCEGGTPPMSEAEIGALLPLLDGWERAGAGITKAFRFKGWGETMAFVNAVAWIAHRENHHPDLEVSYNRCRVSYTTHAVGGLSENDFICAAKVDALLAD